MASSAGAQLDDSCTVSALNRSTRVQADGSWVLPNVPANFGPMRLRATCVDNGVTRSGQSGFVTLPANGIVRVADIVFDAPAPVPARLALTAPSSLLTSPGQTVQLAAVVTYPDGGTADVTTAAAGTSYTISNPAVATIDANGLVTAQSSGTAVVSASNEGALGVLALRVVFGGDSDGDGLPDDFEIANGMDPNNPADALRDHDEDGLTTRDELASGLDPFDPDMDGDGLLDGAEVNQYGTDPLRFDTDGDGLSDGLEVATGSNPLDPASFNLAAALASLEVRPPAFGLTFNTVVGEGSRQLVVLGHLIDGTTIDLVSTARGTTYASSNLAVCNFGAPDGRVFAGANGTCTVTVTNSGHSDQVSITVTSFSPTALAFVDLPGYANEVDVAGNFAYVAAGAAGLVVVDVSDRRAPVIVATADTPGNANDVKVQGSLAYVADGAAGLAVFDLADPLSPALIGQLDTPGIAQDVAIKASFAYVADGTAGLSVIDVTNPAAPVRVGGLASLGEVRGVDVASAAPLAAVAVAAAGIRIVDVANPAAPVLRGGVDTGNARDVAVAGNFAFVADAERSFTAVEFTNPAAPVVRASTPLSLGGLLRDVALADTLAFGADFFFVNGVPIIGVEAPASPSVRAILNFAGFRDDNGTGVAVDGRFVYLTASRTGEENGTTGISRLYIGQYLDFGDQGEVAPTVTILSPQPGTQVIEGTTLLVRANAADDVAVLAVNVEVDGQIVATDSTAPYEVSLTVPVGAASLTVGATAFDLAGNAGTAEPVVVSVIPDPLTTVTGTVVDPDGSPLEGATVTTFGGRSATTNVAGTFFIPDVPTIVGDLAVSAIATIDGQIFRGESAAVPPVPGGMTDVGQIEVSGDYSCRVNITGNSHDCTDGIITLTTSSGTHRVLRVDLDAQGAWQSLSALIRVCNPSGWTMHFADSPSTNGFGGDGGTTRHDAEAHLLHQGWSVFRSDAGGSGQSCAQAGVIPATGCSWALWTVGEDSVSFVASPDVCTGTQPATCSEPFLFELPPYDEADGENPTGSDADKWYVGLNRTVGDSSRNGSGVSEACFVLSTVPKPPCAAIAAACGL